MKRLKGNSVGPGSPLVREAVIASRLKKRQVPRAMIHLDDTPLQDGDEDRVDPNIRHTGFNFYLRYAPIPGENNIARYPPFLLVSDLFERGKMRFRSYKAMMETARINPGLYPALERMIRNCELSAELFDVAFHTPEVRFPVVFHFKRYLDKVGQLAFLPPSKAEETRAVRLIRKRAGDSGMERSD